MTGSYTLLNCEGLGDEKCGCRWEFKEQNQDLFLETEKIGKMKSEVKHIKSQRVTWHSEVANLTSFSNPAQLIEFLIPLYHHQVNGEYSEKS